MGATAPRFRLRGRRTTMQEHTFTGRIAGLVIFRVTEFGTRARFKVEDMGRSPVVCAVEGDVAREFIAHYCEGDKVTVRGIYEPRPSTACRRFSVSRTTACTSANPKFPLLRRIDLKPLIARLAAPACSCRLAAPQSDRLRRPQIRRAAPLRI